MGAVFVKENEDYIVEDLHMLIEFGFEFLFLWYFGNRMFSLHAGHTKYMILISVKYIITFDSIR